MSGGWSGRGSTRRAAGRAAHMVAWASASSRKPRRLVALGVLVHVLSAAGDSPILSSRLACCGRRALLLGCLALDQRGTLSLSVRAPHARLSADGWQQWDAGGGPSPPLGVRVTPKDGCNAEGVCNDGRGPYIPAPRMGHSAVIVSNDVDSDVNDQRVIVFGGRSNPTFVEHRPKSFEVAESVSRPPPCRCFDSTARSTRPQFVGAHNPSCCGCISVPPRHPCTQPWPFPHERAPTPRRTLRAVRLYSCIYCPR